MGHQSCPGGTVRTVRQLLAGKPAAALAKILEGKLNKFFKENCLLQQIFVKDNKTQIDKLLATSAKTLGVENLRVVSFHRLQLGQ